MIAALKGNLPLFLMLLAMALVVVGRWLRRGYKEPPPPEDRAPRHGRGRAEGDEARD